MIRFQAALVLLNLAAGAPAQGLYEGSGQTVLMPPLASPRSPGAHPAVVRVIAPGQGSVSYGSGTLVAASARSGVVITNWHVINEVTGPIEVVFPDGFRSGANILKVDRDWDLAALGIWRPNAQPMPLANSAPQPGETLTIAGYGPGSYRAASGPCTQYVAPGTKFPYEMVELAASARQGDSGGPIVNSRGELAGVLFGEGHGRTTGSYCGRVRWFLSSIVPVDSSPSPTTCFASTEQSPIQKGQATNTAVEDPPNGRPPQLTGAPTGGQVSEVFNPEVSAPMSAIPSKSPSAQRSGSPPLASTSPAPRSDARLTQNPPAVSAPRVQHVGWQDIAGTTLGEQFKSVLAAVGALAVVLHTLRCVSQRR